MFQCVKDQEEGDDFKVRVRWLCQVPKGVSSGEGAVGRAAGGQQGCRIGSGPHVLGCWVLASLPGILALTFTLALAFSCPNFCSLFLGKKGNYVVEPAQVTAGALRGNLIQMDS